jgi:hypothetical protein
MQVQTLPLWPGVSLVLMCEDERWRFSSWGTFERDLPPPPKDECAKWFPTAESAAVHFRALYPRDSAK